MALPAFHTAGTGVFCPNTVANPTTLAASAPAGRSAGDLLVCATFCRSTTATVATPSGWNLVSGLPKSAASSGKVYVFTRIADGTSADDCSVTWTGVTTGTSGDSSGAVILAYSGLTETLDGTVQLSAQNPAGATSVIPAFTTATNNSMVIGLAIKLRDAAGQTSTVATFTERYDAATTNGAGHIEEISDKALTGLSSAGSSGTATITWSDTSNANGITVSLGFKSVMPTGSAALSETVTLTAAGVRKTLGAAARAETLTLTAAGIRKALGAAAVSETVALTAAGVRTVYGSAALNSTVAFTAVGTRAAHGSAALNLTANLGATGTRTAFATAALDLHVALTAAGQRTTYGAAILPLTDTLTAAGVVTSGTIVFPAGTAGTINQPTRGNFNLTTTGTPAFAQNGRIPQAADGVLTKASHQ